MLETIAVESNFQKYLDLVKEKGNYSNFHPKSSKPVLLMGFGHRIFKNCDPRVEILGNLAQELFVVVGKDRLSELAEKFQVFALDDEWVKEKQLTLNVDYWTAVILNALGFPSDMFPVMLALPRYVS